MGYLMITSYTLGFLIPHTQYELNTFDTLIECKANRVLIILDFEK